MTNTFLDSETQSPSAIRIDGRRFYDVVGELCEVVDGCRNRSEYFRRCFDIICRYFDAEIGVLNLRLGARTLEQGFSKLDNPDPKWLQVADSLVLRAQTDETALVKLYRGQNGSAVAYALAAPVLSQSGRPFGAVSLIKNKDNFGETQAELILLAQLLELVADNTPAAIAAKSGAEEGKSKVLQSVVRASDYRSIHHLAFAIVNSLCGKLGCEQIAMGLVRRQNVRIIAVSGLDNIPRNTPGIVAVQQAMAVCVDRNDATVVQEKIHMAEQVESSPCRVHHYWHLIAGDAAVATIPLRIGERCVAVIALRRNSNQPFLPEDIDRARILAGSFAPALPLVDRANRSLLRHVSDSLIFGVGQLLSWKGIGRKVSAVFFLLVAFWIVFGKVDYHFLAPSKIVPCHINMLAAPFEGRIEDVLILPGQFVSKGQLILLMDVRDLKIERNKILSEITTAQIEANNLLQQRKPSEALLLQAQIRVMETELELVEKRIQRARVTAPVSGFVMPTEVHHRVGQFVTLGESLFEIADQHDWRLEIEVPESESLHLSLEQTGSFQTYARPDQGCDCIISKVEPSTQIIDQKNVIVAEATLVSQEDWMKVGMEGYVRIKTTQKPVWWVYGHPVIDYLRMNLWL